MPYNYEQFPDELKWIEHWYITGPDGNKKYKVTYSVSNIVDIVRVNHRGYPRECSQLI